MLKRVLAVASLAAAAVTHAQVPVVEAGAEQSSPMPSAVTPGFIAPIEDQPATVNPQAELFYQLQVLQQEVLQLRGLVEEQTRELQRLKQQRLDDYLDLDRRVSALMQGSGVPVGAGAPISAEGIVAEAAVAKDGVVSASSQAMSAESEAQSYRAAYDLLKQRQIDAAVEAFSRHLTVFPDGKYAANAHYWLGEIFLLKNDLESARQWFTKLLEGFSDHRKVPDAKFKLGKVYDLLGDKAKAKALLEEVAASGAGAARLAKSYLQKHF